MSLVDKLWGNLPLLLPVVLAISVFAFMFPETAQFVLYCFVLAPFKQAKQGKVATSSSQAGMLESFYSHQAAIYDKTRRKLLQGREMMLSLVAAHFHHDVKDKVWIDVGGGTGWNIEQMDKVVRVADFKAIYLVDLSPSLLKIARDRFDRLGWKNVHVVCADACRFTIPEVDRADLITMSYSLSMIPTHHAAVDHLQTMLSGTGVFAVVDFYVSSSNFALRSNLGSVLNRHVSFFNRLFWKTWFEFDRVFLDADRRDYLEYRFGTIKSLNCRNTILGLIPYYVSIMCQKQRESRLINEHEASYTESPYFGPTLPDMSTVSLNEQRVKTVTKGFEVAILNLEAGMPLPSFFYAAKPWRVYYEETLAKHTQFHTYLYAFTWEDPAEDYRMLNLGPKDTILCITSAGDNVLDYAMSSPRRIHAVDLNPLQNHLLELKLASFTALTESDVWQLFGVGIHEDFERLLVDKLSPYLSSHAFQYWAANTRTFTKLGLYETGHSRVAIKAARWLFRLCGITQHVHDMCHAETIEDQIKIWDASVRPVILHPLVSKLLIANPTFLWSALGVPKNQLELVNQDFDNMLEYVNETLDCVVRHTHLRTENYFYYVTIMAHFSKQCRPRYLTEEAYTLFSNKEKTPLDGIRIHTDTVQDVLDRMSSGVLDKAVIMDHLDWFDDGSADLIAEVKALRAAVKPGGVVMFRSASKKPFYTKVFEKYGFRCEQAAVRSDGNCIDRVNMYASTWLCHREGEPSELHLNN